jgi:hypothetical protein
LNVGASSPLAAMTLLAENRERRPASRTRGRQTSSPGLLQSLLRCEPRACVFTDSAYQGTDRM